VRNALILLAVVALLILAVGALNNGTAFDIDYVAGTVTAVSLFWVSAVIAALVFVVGLGAAWFAQAAMTGSRRKLEAELQSTYVRLREAEALAARPAPAAEPEPATVVAEPEPTTVVDTEEVTVVAGEAETVGSDEAPTVVASEAVTVVDTDESETVVADAAPSEDAAAAGMAADTPADGGVGERTAITMAGGAPANEPPADPDRAESAEGGPPAADAGRAGSAGS
jgi:hypothetical protein